jgi:hypothetical protein
VTGDVALPFTIELVDFEIEKKPQEPGLPPAVNERLVVLWPDRGLRADLPAAPGTERLLVTPGEEATADNTFRVAVLRREPDFVMDIETREVNSRSQEPRNPAILVRVAGAGTTNAYWLFARYPDFNTGSTNAALSELELYYETDTEDSSGTRGIGEFRSTVRILDGNEVIGGGTIRVNAPLSHAGYKFYQFSYDPRDPTQTSLQVVKDPSIPLVFSGYALMIVGLTTVLYVCRGTVPGPNREGVPE